MPILHEPVDIVVVGSGMGGAAFRYRLSTQAPSLRITCLERGDWLPAKQMPATRPLALSTWALASSPSAAYRVDDSAAAVKPLMWRGVGGSRLTWAAHFPRLHPSDFRTQRWNGVDDAWPFSYFDLEPYYDLNNNPLALFLNRVGVRQLSLTTNFCSGPESVGQ